MDGAGSARGAEPKHRKPFMFFFCFFLRRQAPCGLLGKIPVDFD